MSVTVAKKRAAKKPVAKKPVRRKAKRKYTKRRHRCKELPSLPSELLEFGLRSVEHYHKDRKSVRERALRVVKILREMGL